MLGNDDHAFQRRSLQTPAADGLLPSLREVIQALRVSRRIGGVQLLKPHAQSRRHLINKTRVRLYVRVPGGVHVALGAIQLTGNVKLAHKISCGEVARLSRLNFCVA